MWVDKRNEFYNNFLKKWLKAMTKMYSTNNDGKYVIAKRFIRTLKNKMYNRMTSVSKKCLC